MTLDIIPELMLLDPTPNTLTSLMSFLLFTVYSIALCIFQFPSHSNVLMLAIKISLDVWENIVKCIILKSEWIYETSFTSISKSFV